MADKLVKEGKYAVLRDSAGNVVTRVTSTGNNKEDWRTVLRRLTNNGQNQFERIIDISEGRPFQATLPDGRTSEPIVPAAAIQFAAGQFLLEMMHGKAVAQTEMRKAEAETKLVEQFRALSDAELKARVIEALAKKKELAEGHNHDPQKKENYDSGTSEPAASNPDTPKEPG